MTSELKETLLKDLTILIARGITPKYVNEHGTIVINQKCIRDGILSLDPARQTSNEKKISSEKLILENDILVNSTGVGTLGRVAQVKNLDFVFTVDSHVTIVRPDEKKVDSKYLGYLVRSKEKQIEALAEGSTGQTELSRHKLERLKLKVIQDKYAQKKIASFLSSLDKKIELNKKINQTLESIAQTIFKSWFVDFDPVPAKANAQSEDEFDAIAKELGISREILDLFPSEFEESELGLIPKGWRPNKIENYIEILDSKRVPLSKNEREKRKGNIPYYGATSIMDYIDDFLFDEPLTLIGEDGSVVKEDGTPFTQYIWGKSWVNNHAHVLKAKKNLSTEGIYILFKDTNVSSYVTGAVQPKINQNNLKRIPILEPSNHLYGEFSKFIDPLFSMVRIRTDETLQLCKLRDYLLPKLLSGEIDVSNLNLEPDND
ncbi:TPA: restriction endonuclease subunit S [Legionella pneumophila]|nr:restriction endonuclease subunit S [Legionella pneumophila]